MSYVALDTLGFCFVFCLKKEERKAGASQGLKCSGNLSAPQAVTAQVQALPTLKCVPEDMIYSGLLPILCQDWL